MQSNDSSSALVGQISQQVGDIASDKLGHRITATYIEGVLSQTEVLKKQLGKAADGAHRISATARAAWATARAGSVTAPTSWPAGSASSRVGPTDSPGAPIGWPAARPAWRAASAGWPGARSRSTAGPTSSPAASNVSTMRRSPVRGPGRAAGERSTPADLDQLGTGVAGLVQLAQGLQQACAADPTLPQAMPELCQAADDAVAQAAALQGGVQQVQQLSSSLGQLSQGLPQLVGAVGSAADGADRLAAGTSRAR